MPIRDQHPHATFSYEELGTDDLKASKAFYGELFNWTYEDVPVAPGLMLTMCKVQGKRAAVLRQRPDELRGKPVRWLSYITVTDLDETLAKITGSGGELVRPPADIPNTARMAVVKDPLGARFGLWQAKGIIGAEVMEEPGALRWNELYTPNAQAMETFYANTFGWTTQTVDMGIKGMYILFSRPGETQNAAGIMPSIAADQESQWVPYFTVEDVDTAHQKVTELGGTSVEPPVDIPVGRFAMVTDPHGAKFALFKDPFF